MVTSPAANSTSARNYPPPPPPGSYRYNDAKFILIYFSVKETIFFLFSDFKSFVPFFIKVLLTVYMSTLTYWSFLFLYFFARFLCGAIRLCVRLSLLSHEIEQFVSLYMCAPKKDIGRSGSRTRYFQSPSQPRYQRAILAPQFI